MPHRFDSGLYFDSGLFWDAVTADPETPLEAASRADVGFVQPVARFSVLAGLDGPVLATFEDDDQRIQSGTITVNRTLTVRRSASLSLVDVDGTLAGLLPVGAWFRVERGQRLDGVPDYLALFTGVVDGFTADMQAVLAITGRDPLALCSGPFGDAVVITDRTPAEDALRTVWEPVLGDGSDWPLDGGGRLMPQRVFLPGDNRLDDVVRFFQRSGLEVYADRLGRPLMRPALDPTKATSVATVKDFRPGPTSTILRLSRRGNPRVYNQVTVTSNSPGGPDVSATVPVNDPASPIHPDRIGLHPAPPVISPQLPDQSAANDLALQVLADYAFAAETVDGEAVPDITLDAGDVVTIEEPVSGTSGRYRLDTVTLPVTTGSMSLTAGRVVPLLLDDEEAA